MELNELERQRAAKMEWLRAAGMEVYPPRVHRTHSTAEALQIFAENEGQETPLPPVTLAGRLISIRRAATCRLISPLRVRMSVPEASTKSPRSKPLRKSS